jgi:hypothetical protein
MKSNMAKSERAKVQREAANRGEVARLPGWGLPPHLGCKLKMSTTWNINHAGTFQTFGFSCNNPYQPCQTATTDEVPSYIGFLTQAYENLYVVRSKIRVELINSTVADSISVALGYDGNTAGATTINTLSETRDARGTTVGYYSAGNNKAVLSSQFTPERFLSIPPNSVNNICVGDAPPDQYYWVLGLQSIAGGTGNVGARVVVEYDVVFTQLVAPPP